VNSRNSLQNFHASVGIAHGAGKSKTKRNYQARNRAQGAPVSPARQAGLTDKNPVSSPRLGSYNESYQLKPIRENSQLLSPGENLYSRMTRILKPPL
jgi:hypothetical protein